MDTPRSENTIKTVLELDLASYSDIARALEENLDVYAVKAFEDQVQSFVDHGLAAVGLARDDVVLGSAGDNAILVFDDPAVMHRFAEAVQQSVAGHNARKSVESAKRWFRMGAATGPVLLLQAERRIVGTTVARAVRLEAAAKCGQILVDAATYEILPDGLKGFYGREEEVSGKRDERFHARRCTFVPAGERSTATRSARRTVFWVTVAVACLVCGVVAVSIFKNQGAESTNRLLLDNLQPDSLEPNRPSQGRDRDAARWAAGIGAEVKVDVRGAVRTVLKQADLPDEPFKLTHVNFRGVREITDADLKNLSGTSIIDLNLAETRITDAGLDAIADLPLFVLDLNGVGGITDMGAERIGRMSRLRWLYLSYTKVSDDGLTSLTKLNELQELTVVGTRVTQAGVEEFRTVLQKRGQRCIIQDDWSGRD